jgi:hypothetical protein
MEKWEPSSTKCDSLDNALAETEVNLRVLQQEKVPCPHVYEWGRRCPGHMVRVECYKADLGWSMGADGRWLFGWRQSPSHFHLLCSEKGSHAGLSKEDERVARAFRVGERKRIFGRHQSGCVHLPALKFYLRELPAELRRLLAEVPPPKSP